MGNISFFSVVMVLFYEAKSTRYKEQISLNSR